MVHNYESVYLFYRAIFSNHIIFPPLCGVNFLLYSELYSLEALLSLICLNTGLHFV